jgi:hypothetical protein
MMTEPAATATSSIATVAATSLTILGLRTGLDPNLLLAGLAGALLELSYGEPRPPWRRLTGVLSASLLAGYLTPAAVAIVRIKSLLPDGIAEDVLMPAAAASIGFLSYRVIGPALLRIANKLAGDAPK